MEFDFNLDNLEIDKIKYEKFKKKIKRSLISNFKLYQKRYSSVKNVLHLIKGLERISMKKEYVARAFMLKKIC